MKPTDVMGRVIVMIFKRYWFVTVNRVNSNTDFYYIPGCPAYVGSKGNKKKPAYNKRTGIHLFLGPLIVRSKLAQGGTFLNGGCRGFTDPMYLHQL